MLHPNAVHGNPRWRLALLTTIEPKHTASTPAQALWPITATLLCTWGRGGVKNPPLKNQECRTTSAGKPERSSLKQILNKLIGRNTVELDSLWNYSSSDYLLSVKPEFLFF